MIGSEGKRENLTEKRSEFYAEARTFLEQYTIDKNILTELINYCDARLFDYDANYY